METAVKIGCHNVASEKLCCEHRRLSCFCVWGEANLVDDVLNYLSLKYLDLSVLKTPGVHIKVILYVSLVLNI